jgi:hypothetical protein
MGWDGMGWDGVGWDGMGWDGMGWEEVRTSKGRVGGQELERFFGVGQPDDAYHNLIKYQYSKSEFSKKYQYSKGEFST